MIEYPNSNIIHSDVDTIWFEDPRPHFIGNYDFFGQLDGVIDGRPYLSGYVPYFCTGFLALRNTKLTLKLIRTWSLDMKNNENDVEQVKFNALVNKLHINGRVLPMATFPCGTLYFQQMPQSYRNKAIIVHNNFVFGIPAKAKVCLVFNQLIVSIYKRR